MVAWHRNSLALAVMYAEDTGEKRVIELVPRCSCGSWLMADHVVWDYLEVGHVVVALVDHSVAGA